MKSSILLLLVGCGGDATPPAPEPLPDLEIVSVSLVLDPCATSVLLGLELPATYANERVTVSMGSFVDELVVGADGRIDQQIDLAANEHLCGVEYATNGFESSTAGCMQQSLSVVHGSSEVLADLEPDTGSSTRVAYTSDEDGDGFAGDGAVERWACQPLSLFHPTDDLNAGEDCNDTDVLIFPGQIELCSGVDEDCDGLLDDGAPGYRLASSTIGSSSVLVLDTLIDDDTVEICGGVAIEGTVTASNVRLMGVAADALITGRAVIATGADLTVDFLDWTGVPDEEGAFAFVNGELSVFGESGAAMQLECPVSAQPARGGAFVVEGGALELVDVDVEGCSADRGGAIDALDSTLELVNTSFMLNRSGGHGGTLYQQGGTLTIRSSTMQRSAAVGDGGAIWASDVDGILDSVTLFNNDALVDGGALWLHGDAGMRVENCTLEGNIAGIRGGAAVLEGEVSVFGGTFSGNTADEQAGALFFQALGGLDGAAGLPIAFSGNSAPLGGAVVLAQGDLVGPITFDGNSAGRGGALVIQSVSASPLDIVLPDLTFTNNAATQNGGAVSIASIATLNAIDVQRATFTGNTALNGAAWHQPIAAELGFDAQASANIATGSGGVVFASSASGITLSGIYTDNQANRGAVVAASVGLVDLFGDGLVLTGNDALGGGVLETGGEVVLSAVDAWSNGGTGIIATSGIASVSCTDCTFVGPTGELSAVVVDFGGVASTIGAGAWDLLCVLGSPCEYVTSP